VGNASVTITHVPSGTVSRTTTSADGVFTASGLRVGGPYTVAVSSKSGSTSVTDIYTVAGQPFNVPVDIAPQSAAIVVTATRVRGAGVIGTGPSTVLNANDISKVASVNRDIRDLMRRDPFATLDTSQSTGRQVTFAGTNPRFNRFTIDGVPITDSFGLNPDALPSRRGPVPLDSIGEFQTKVAPYDIREGFFQGGVINAILRSGTNHFQGTAFFTYNSDELTGSHLKPYGSNTTGVIVQPNFTSKDYGVELSGPIIKDRLFFMVAGERVRANLPYSYGVAGSGAATTVSYNQAVYDQIVGIAKNKYGVEAGPVLTSQGDKDDRLVGRLDANIADGQRLSLTGIYTKDAINTLGNTGATTLSTLSNDYVKPNRVIAGVANWNAKWSDTISTETRVMYKDYKSGQNPILAKTAYALICSDAVNTGSATSCSTGVSQLAIGPLGSAQTNILHTKTFDAQELVRLSLGAHNVKLLYDYQHVSNYNLFIGQTYNGGTSISAGAYGAYYFDSIAAFNAGTASEFAYANATTGNPNDAAAIFDYATHTIGIQDDWKVNPNLTVTAGVRYDVYASASEPLLNQYFVVREGFPNNSFMEGRGLLQPRVGFDWKVTPRLDVHGGVGIFGGGTPDVYIGNSFSSSGVQPVLYGTNSAASPFLQNVSLTAIPAGATAALAGTKNAPVAAIDPDFKIPSQWRGSLSGTYDLNFGPLGDHWIAGASVLLSKTREGILYRDGRMHPITGAGALTPDGRQRYFDATPASQGGSSGNADTILGNTSRGHGYIGVVSLSKKWDFGLSAFASFTYQDVWDQAAVTSSIASSNYNNTAYLDANSGAFGHSNDEVRYSVKYDLGFEHAFFRNARTRIDLFGETRIGSPYSYTMAEAGTSGGRGAVFGSSLTSTTAGRYLFYVPTGINDPLVTYDSTTTRDRIDAIINSTGLKNYRGKIAPRNAFNSKWFTKIDLHVEQEIPTFVGKSKISLFADIENLPNLLNHKWGEQLRNFFPYTDQVARVACVAGGGNPCAQYKYSSPATDSFLADQLITTNGSSLYSIRLGARFSF
jgi:hypothetical protein